MMTTLNARNLTLNEVRHFFNFQEKFNNTDKFSTLLMLEPLSEIEQQELVIIRFLKLFVSYKTHLVSISIKLIERDLREHDETQ
ncbi:hypothetical protein BCD67_18755 [Oscillatoriales cyanobacterium USR001]|nr:hypothetical protein BCD67_18755 [Oscillatoriales cyanobacterium USR001]